ncbi:MAG: RidA family protein [Planctomycetota bacterium]
MKASIQPAGWARPKGYSNGVLVEPGARLLFVAGQIAWDENQALVAPNDFGGQFHRALANVCTIVEAAGGSPRDLADMTVYVTDKRQYLAQIAAVGGAWKELIGKHFPTMALVEVAGLLEPGALVEIKAVAAIDGGAR